MRVALVAAFLALLSGCAPAPEVAPPALADPTPAQIDTMDAGLALADQWAAAGHPFNEWVRTPQQAQFARTLCPKHARPRRGSWGDPQGCPRRGRGHEYDWYVHAVDERPAFVSALLQRHDPLLTEIALVNVQEHFGEQAALLLARGLDGDHALWQTALEVIASEVDAEGSLPVAHEAWRHGRAHPEARGDVLYVLALAESANGEGADHAHVLPWDRFGEWFGSTLTREDFRAYLDHGKRAEEMMGSVCRALGKGWSPASVVLPRIRLALAGDVDTWQPTLATEAERCLCAEGDVSGLAGLAETFRAVAAEHPGSRYVDLAQRFTEDARRCKVRP